MAVSDTDNATLETSPVPNHRTTIGASAIFGTLLMATMKGSTSRATNTEYQSASPSNDPKMVPMINPRMASNNVYHVSEISSPLRIILYARLKIPVGDPTKKAEIHPARIPISHRAKNDTTAATCSIARPSVVSNVTRRPLRRAFRFCRVAASGIVMVKLFSRCGGRVRRREKKRTKKAGRGGGHGAGRARRYRYRARSSHGRDAR